MAPVQNKYCERLGIAVPRVEGVAERGKAKLFHLMVVALLEHGAPMTLDEIAERLEAAGVEAETGDVAYSLQKAWHGMEPVYRDGMGRFGLNLDSFELGFLVRSVGLQESMEPPPPVPVPLAPSDDVPLSEEEIEAAFRDGRVTSLSWIRQAAAVLDARPMPMAAEEIETLLAGLTKHRIALGPRNGPGKSDLFVIDEAGRLTRNAAAAGLIAVRRAIRKLSHPVLVQRAQRVAREKRWEVRRAELDAEARRDAEVARELRRAVVHVLSSGNDPAAAAVLDVKERSIRTFIGRELADLAGVLEGFDIIAGLYIRDLLIALALDADRFRVVDLKPPKKSRRLNRAGRTLQITPELLIGGTTGISHPFGEPEKVARYLSEGDHPKLARRLESDVKALHAFYQYGALHGSVRLRWGFINDGLAVEWALPGDLSLYAQLKAAQESGAAVEVVVGAAPGWSDPWSRAQRVHVIDFRAHDVLVTENAGRIVFPIALEEIQAVRLAPDRAGER